MTWPLQGDTQTDVTRPLANYGRVERRRNKWRCTTKGKCLHLLDLANRQPSRRRPTPMKLRPAQIQCNDCVIGLDIRHSPQGPHNQCEHYKVTPRPVSLGALWNMEGINDIETKRCTMNDEMVVRIMETGKEEKEKNGTRLDAYSKDKLTMITTWRQPEQCH